MPSFSSLTTHPLIGQTTVPGDKSIAHRSLIVHCLCAPQVTRTISNLPPNADVIATLHCIQQLGILTEYSPLSQTVTLTTPKIWPLKPSSSPVTLDAKNSGTTIRLLSGLLNGLNQNVMLVGDSSLSRRPMQRITTPLSEMGALIHATHDTQYNRKTAPIRLTPRSNLNKNLSAITYSMPIASAQVKSAILLAGLHAQGTTTVIETIPTRDHTERMLNALGITVQTTPVNNTFHTSVTGPIQPITNPPAHFTIPGDISSAIFLLVLSAITPGSKITLMNIGINPGRTGALDVLKQWGTQVTLSNHRLEQGEPVADISLVYQPLKGNITLEKNDIPALVDELPILAIAAAFVDGTFQVTGAEELRHKECDRLEAIQTLFNTIRLPITMHPDGFTITGTQNPDITLPEKKHTLPTFGDHRIGLCWHVLNHRFSVHTRWTLDQPQCIGVSFPNFTEVLSQLTHNPTGTP